MARALLFIFSIYLSLTTAGHCQNLLEGFTFQVLAPPSEDVTAQFDFIVGDERKNNSQNRLSMISESQNDYPAPESGCGPVALLNTVVWYEKFGLIEPLFREANPERYKKRLFAEIDRRLMSFSNRPRWERGGSRNTDIARVLDQIVTQQSGGELRIHTDYTRAPIQLNDLLDTMPNFRVGYILGYPKDPETGEMQGLHAMTLIRADRAGHVTLATWGEKYQGILRMRGENQWFIPREARHSEIKLVGMQRFIPFRPKAVSDRSLESQSAPRAD